MTKVEAVKIIMTIIVPLTNDPHERLFWYGLGVSIVTAWPPVPGECRQGWAHEINEAAREAMSRPIETEAGFTAEQRKAALARNEDDSLI